MRAAVATDPWLDVPSLSTGELVWALRHSGLVARVGGPEHMVLVDRGIEVARVPMRERLHPGIIVALLHTLGVTLEQLSEYIAAREG